MLQYLLKRIGFALLSIWAVLTITFFIAYLAPGDPIEQKMGQHSDPALLAKARHEAGLDKPPLIRYGLYVWNLLHGDLGKSYYTNEPITAFLARGLPNTFKLALAAIVLALVIGIIIGLVAAVKPNTFLDRLLMLTVLTGVSVPTFVLAPVLILIFAVRLNWLPVAEWQIDNFHGFTYVDPIDLVLPAFVLAARPAALIARMTRSSMLETLKQDYIRTARAKGLSPVTILVKHALRNAFLPVLTTAGVSFGYLLAGSFVVETIFTVPGVGAASIQSLSQRDYTLIQGTTLVIAVAFVTVNLVIDLLYAVLDPRVKVVGGTA
jgi:peptide/nickel transport system permease protein